MSSNVKVPSESEDDYEDDIPIASAEVQQQEYHSNKVSTINDFEVEKKIGKLPFYVIFYNFLILGDGAYSNVYKVKRLEDGQEYALKKVKLDHLSEKERENAINEVRILASVKHPNVIQYKEAFMEEKTKSLW